MATLATGVVNVTTDAGVQNAIIERYMVRALLRLADKECVFYKLGKKVAMPKGESKVITFTRWERIAPPVVKLVEGVTPTGTTLKVSRVNATLEQWGSFCTISDVMELTVRNEPFQRATELNGLQAAETLDREVQRVLWAATNVYYPNGRTSRATLTGSDTINTPLLRKIRAQLKHNGAPGVSGGTMRKVYIGVCDSFNSQDIMADTTFVESAKFQNLQPLTSGEFGEWMGIRWQESNNIPVIRRSDLINATTAAVDYATGTTPANTTALDTGTYKIAITGNDAGGFETLLQNEDYGSTGFSGAASGSEDITITLTALTPATDSGISTSHTFDPGLVSYNIYATQANGSTYTLQAANLAGGVYHLVKADTGGASTTIVLSSTGQAPPLQPADGINIHQVYIFGNEWYQVAELEGVRTMVTPAGATAGNELAQRRSVGWKFFSKALITNENFGCRIETESEYDDALTA